MQKRRYEQLKIKKTYKKKQLMILIVIAITLCSFIVIFGRYITKDIKDFFIRSKEFYFYSDKLNEELSIFQIDNWSGVDDYVLTINMNSRKNNIEAATYDIGYDIKYTCSDNVICQLSKTKGIIRSDTNTDFFNLTITPNAQLDTGDKVVIEIEATSNTNYTKTIKGRFTLVVGKEKFSYQITDSVQNPYMELRLTNTLSYYIVDTAFDSYKSGQKIDSDTYLSLSEDKKQKCYSSIATIEFNPKEILLDITNENYASATNIKTKTIDGKNYVNSITIEIDAISSVNLRFYKADVTQNYTYPNADNLSIVKITTK